MANILKYDPTSATIANRVVEYLESQDTGKWTGVPNVLVNPVMPVGIGIAYLKVDGGNVVELTQVEKDALTAAAAAGALLGNKSGAKGLFDDLLPNGRVLRALVEVLLNEINALRGHVVGVATFNWDPASIANGAGLTSPNAPMANLQFGDEVKVVAPYSLAGLTLTAYVQAAGFFNARLENQTGAAVNLAAGTWKAVAYRTPNNGFPDRTLAQARDAILNNIDAQT